MNKLFGLLALLSILMGAMFVSAVEIDYGARCDIVRPATEFRPEKVYYGAGIYGRVVDKIGDNYYPVFTCFSPGKHKVKPVATASSVNPVCHDVTTCDPAICHIEETTCRFWDYDWNCGLVGTGCHRHWICHWDKTDCKVWNTEQVCDSPICNTVSIC
jgi:hypothetical protein